MDTSCGTVLGGIITACQPMRTQDDIVNMLTNLDNHKDFFLKSGFKYYLRIVSALYKMCVIFEDVDREMFFKVSDKLKKVDNNVSLDNYKDYIQDTIYGDDGYRTLVKKYIDIKSLLRDYYGNVEKIAKLHVSNFAKKSENIRAIACEIISCNLENDEYPRCRQLLEENINSIGILNYVRLMRDVNMTENWSHVSHYYATLTDVIQNWEDISTVYCENNYESFKTELVKELYSPDLVDTFSPLIFEDLKTDFIPKLFIFGKYDKLLKFFLLVKKVWVCYAHEDALEILNIIHNWIEEINKNLGSTITKDINAID